MICQNCGKEMPDGSKFCTKCGSPVQEKKPAAKRPEPLLCAGCGAPLKPGAKFCFKCGRKVGEPAGSPERNQPNGNMGHPEAGNRADETEVLIPEADRRQELPPRPAPIPPRPPAPPAPEPVKKKKTGLIIGLAAGLFLLACALGAALWLLVIPALNGGTLPFMGQKAGITDEFDEESESGEEETESSAESQKERTTEAVKETEPEAQTSTTAYVWGTESTTAAFEPAPTFAASTAAALPTTAAAPTDPVYGNLATAASRYILPDSASRYLAEADLAGLSKEELRLARNEIYARHGRIFDSPELSDYFNSQNWYQGTIKGADFDESVLNVYEKDNLLLIKGVEDKLN